MHVDSSKIVIAARPDMNPCVFQFQLTTGTAEYLVPGTSTGTMVYSTLVTYR